MTQLRWYGEKLEDDRIIEKILRYLTSKFHYVIFVIEESKDRDTMSTDQGIVLFMSMKKDSRESMMRLSIMS